MYLHGYLAIDPSQLTDIDTVKPTKGFARLAHLLTGGLSSKKDERETFCAVTILQQINVVMRSLGIDNVVRLAKDDTVFYEDDQGREGDLKQAMDEFANNASPGDIKLFNTLELVLEYHTAELSYLIDIRIQRRHRVGEHPIQIRINGMPKSLGGTPGKEFDRGRMQQVFDSQQTYDAFINGHEELFAAFLNDLRDAFRDNMKVDDVRVTSSVKIIRPSQRVNSRSDIPRNSSGWADPVYHDHHGYEEAFFYAWLWSDFCHASDIRCHDCTIVDSTGCDIMSVAPEGFQAGENDTLNVDEPFCSPADGHDVQIFSDNEYSADITSESTKLTGFGAPTDSSGGWLSSFSDSFGGDSSSCGGSSCGGSSCGGSSCGGGCGGE